MKGAIVRFAAMYVFTVVVLLVVGLLLPSVQVGWHALWAAVVLTLAAMLVKPLLTSAFRKGAAKQASTRTKTGERLVQYGIVFIVELLLWLLTVWLSGVRVQGWFWGYVLPPVILLIAWVVYDAIDDRVEAKAGEIYDAAGATLRGGAGAPAGTPAPETPETRAARTELNDGLTPEQRKMLDDLG